MNDKQLTQFINNNERILNNIASFMLEHKLNEMLLQESTDDSNKVVLSFIFQE